LERIREEVGYLDLIYVCYTLSAQRVSKQLLLFLISSSFETLGLALKELLFSSQQVFPPLRGGDHSLRTGRNWRGTEAGESV